MYIKEKRYKYRILHGYVSILSPPFFNLRLFSREEFNDDFLEPYGFIYKITNLSNDKIYIGKTVKDIGVRLLEHIAGSKKHQNTFLEKAIAKYGDRMFDVEELWKCYSDKEMNEREKHFIKKYNSIAKKFGYNLTEGGDGGGAGELNPFYGKKHTEEFKKWLSNKRKIEYVGENNPNFGNHILKGVKRPYHSLLMLLNNPFKGEKHSENSKEKMRCSIRKSYENGRIPSRNTMHGYREFCSCVSCISHRNKTNRIRYAS